MDRCLGCTRSCERDLGTRRRPASARYTPAMERISAKAASFTESVIREMNRLAVEAGAVSLAQGFPDFPCPIELKDAAAAALHADVNQYAITWGAPRLRQAIASKTARTYPGWTPDPDTEITVTCGATEAMIAGDAGAARPGRRGHRLRAVLRELRPGRRPRPTPGRATSRSTSRTGRSTRTSSARRSRRGPGRSSSTPRTTRRARSSRATSSRSIADLCIEHDLHRLHRRDLRAHHLRRRAHPAGHPAGDGRADGHHQFAVEDVLGHRLAGRLGHRAGRPVGRRPAGPRLPDRRRGGPAPGGGRRRARSSRLVLRRARRPPISSGGTRCSGRSTRPASGRSARTAPTTS